MKYLIRFLEAAKPPIRKRRVPKKINDYIEKYKEDIEDAVLPFTDMGYEISYQKGGDDYSSLPSDFQEFSINNTSYTLTFSYTEGVDVNDAGIADLKSEMDFIKKSNLYETTISCIRRLQSFGLKIKYDYDDFRNFWMTIVCKEDPLYNEIPLL